MLRISKYFFDTKVHGEPSAVAVQGLWRREPGVRWRHGVGGAGCWCSGSTKMWDDRHATAQETLSDHFRSNEQRQILPMGAELAGSTRKENPTLECRNFSNAYYISIFIFILFVIIIIIFSHIEAILSSAWSRSTFFTLSREIH